MNESFAGDVRLYHDLVSQVDVSAQPYQLIIGGRGWGKTTFLRQLCEANDVKDPADHVISGRDAVRALARLRDVLAAREDAQRHDEVRLVVIDDIDYLVDPSVIGNPATTDELQKVVIRVAGQASSNSRVVATCTRSGFQQIQSYSPSPIDQYRVDLTPWAWASKNALQKWANSVQRETPEQWVELAERSWPVDDVFTKDWVKAVIDVTGMHPQLIGAAATDLTRRLAPGPASNGTNSSTNLPDALRLLLTATLDRTGMVPIRRRINSLAQADGAEGVAFDVLWRIAKQDQDGVPFDTVSPEVKREVSEAVRLLENEGLVYYDPKSLRHQVLGDLIQRHVLIERREPSTELLSDRVMMKLHRINEERGLIRHDDGTAHSPSIEVRGVTWNLLRQLDARDGAWTPTKELKDALGLPSVGAVRAAVQRLTAQLKGLGLGDLIENKRGGGYRLSRDVSIFPRAFAETPAVFDSPPLT